MTLDDLKKNIEHLKSIAHDDECAHGFEDQIREQVLDLIANGTLTRDEMIEFARIVLTTSEIDFARWCA